MSRWIVVTLCLLLVAGETPHPSPLPSGTCCAGGEREQEGCIAIPSGIFVASRKQERVVYGEDAISVRRAITGLGEFRQVGDALLIADDTEPQIRSVGYLQLAGEFDTASVIADDVNREIVPVRKVTERDWVIEGQGRVVVVATLATREPFGIEQRRYDITIKPLRPEPEPDPEPDNPDPGPEPDEPDPQPVPPDRFDNLGKRVAELAAGLPRRSKVAENYRRYAEQLKTSVEAAEISQAMVDTRGQILIGVEDQWQPVLNLIEQDFTARRPQMVRSDVVDHWLAIAGGLDPQSLSQE